MRFAASGWPKIPKTPHSSLNLSSMGCMAQPAGGDADSILRCPSPECRAECGRPGCLGLGHRTIERDGSRDGHPQARPAGPADRRCAGTPCSAASCSSAGASESAHADDDARCRLAEQRRARSPERPARPPRPQRGTSTSRPMPAVSNAHSASVTASPPSEQSCADASRPRDCGRRQTRQSARARARGRAPAAGPRPGRARPSDTRCRRARRALAEQHDRSPSRWNARLSTRRRILDQADHADDRRRVDRLAVGLVVEADVAAGDRHVERAAGVGDPLDRLRRAAT